MEIVEICAHRECENANNTSIVFFFPSSANSTNCLYMLSFLSIHTLWIFNTAVDLVCEFEKETVTYVNDSQDGGFRSGARQF